MWDNISNSITENFLSPLRVTTTSSTTPTSTWRSVSWCYLSLSPCHHLNMTVQYCSMVLSAPTPCPSPQHDRGSKGRDPSHSRPPFFLSLLRASDAAFRFLDLDTLILHPSFVYFNYFSCCPCVQLPTRVIWTGRDQSAGPLHASRHAIALFESIHFTLYFNQTL